MSEGKNVLILGGSGFIGRNLVKYLVDNKLAAFIRVADKSLPACSYLNSAHKEAFEQKEIVEFKQADLSKDAHVARAFDGHHFDYVVNVCGETRCGMNAQDYVQKCEETAKKCSAAAADHKVDRWVEVSTAQVYAGDKKAATESAKLKPWTLVATSRLRAEEAVRATPGLPSVVLRPALVYGPGDLTGLSPRITVAAAFVELGEKMKTMWDKGLQLNTVHVDDVCQAIWMACRDLKPGSIFNLADETALTQGVLNGMLGDVFGIQTSCLGSLVSNLAKMQLSAAADHANDRHVPTWAKLCQSKGVLNTPLSPYIDKELLYNNNLAVDGTSIAKESDFSYQHPKLTKKLLLAQIQGFEDQGVFPKGLLKE